MTITNSEAEDWADLRADLHTAMWRKRVTQTAAAAAVGVGQSTFGKKMRGEVVMTAAELVTLARFIGLTITIAPEGIFVIDDDDEPVERARRDSNPQPSDLYLGLLPGRSGVKPGLTVSGLTRIAAVSYLRAVANG